MLVAAVVVEPLLAVMEAWVVEAMAVRVRLLVVLEALLLVAVVVVLDNLTLFLAAQAAQES
jgi:hypothetical protein